MKVRSQLFIGMIIGALVGGLLGYFFFQFRQEKLAGIQRLEQQSLLKQQFDSIEAERSSDLVCLLGNMLDKVDAELTDNPGRTLSDETISRIAALSYGFTPYVDWEGDSISPKKYSPERGKLLLALSFMDLDPGTLDQIMSKAPFSSANLKGADLAGTKLKGANLREANLSDANLRKANLSRADLWGANLWGAVLDSANLYGAELKRSDLSWAELNEADLRTAHLDGANLTNAKLRKADLRGTVLQWANLEGAFLFQSRLDTADLTGVRLVKTNLSKANLREADLQKSDLTEANLVEADLTGALVREENWLEKLTEWRVVGATEIQDGYKMVKDTIAPSAYRLEKLVP